MPSRAARGECARRHISDGLADECIIGPHHGESR